jgi:hypothetical protein
MKQQIKDILKAEFLKEALFNSGLPNFGEHNNSMGESDLLIRKEKIDRIAKKLSSRAIAQYGADDAKNKGYDALSKRYHDLSGAEQAFSAESRKISDGIAHTKVNDFLKSIPQDAPKVSNKTVLDYKPGKSRMPLYVAGAGAILATSALLDLAKHKMTLENRRLRNNRKVGV